MIKAILTDFSHVLIFAKDPEYAGGINDLYVSKKDEDTFNFWDYFVLNDTLIQAMEALRASVPVYIFTSRVIQDDPAIQGMLGKTFSGVFAAEAMGLSKKDSETFRILCERIGCAPEEVVYLDDKESAAAVAKQAGLQTFQHVSNEITIETLTEMISR